MMIIQWTKPAITDLEGIREYIGRDSEYYAARFIGRIIEAVERLEVFPEMGRRVPDATEEENVREPLFQNYRIMYRPETQRIEKNEDHF
jgi:toxin ParE1/3/4